MNRKSGTCHCGAHVPSGTGLAVAPSGYGRKPWEVLCPTHAADHQRQYQAVEDDRLAYYGSAERADSFAPSGW